MANYNNNKPPADPEIKECFVRLQNIDKIYLDALAIGGQLIIDDITGKFTIETSDDNQLTAAAAVVVPVRKSLRNKQLLVPKTTVQPTTNQRERSVKCNDCRKIYRNLKNLNSHRCSATKLMPTKFRQIQPPESALLPPMPAKRPLKSTNSKTATKKRPKSVISDTNNVDNSPERESQPDVVNISAANDTIAVNVLSDDNNNNDDTDNDNTDAGNSVKPTINERWADKNRQK
ncbi:uncharacterized protein LOC128953148 [Oppia nitens]|uniref:uncharacterized protein LOC128953148 n=1 Tax=Oppia nitens TaxID=1686743 RepID=UPI0023DC625D|nr:uncharacterized protein LOC128953148 [Oppia nitens]